MPCLVQNKALTRTPLTPFWCSWSGALCEHRHHVLSGPAGRIEGGRCGDSGHVSWGAYQCNQPWISLRPSEALCGIYVVLCLFRSAAAGDWNNQQKTQTPDDFTPQVTFQGFYYMDLLTDTLLFSQVKTSDRRGVGHNTLTLFRQIIFCCLMTRVSTQNNPELLVSQEPHFNWQKVYGMGTRLRVILLCPAAAVSACLSGWLCLLVLFLRLSCLMLLFASDWCLCAGLYAIYVVPIDCCDCM